MKVKFLQMGGEMAPEAQGAPMGPEAAPAEAAAPGGEEQAMQQLAQLAQQIIQQLGPEAAGALAQMILEMIQGGGEEPMPAAEDQPVFRMGGKLQRGRR